MDRSFQALLVCASMFTQRVQTLLKYEFGDLRIRLERKITFADPSDETESELSSEESREGEGD